MQHTAHSPRCAKVPVGTCYRDPGLQTEGLKPTRKGKHVLFNKVCACVAVALRVCAHVCVMARCTCALHTRVQLCVCACTRVCVQARVYRALGAGSMLF